MSKPILIWKLLSMDIEKNNWEEFLIHACVQTVEVPVGDRSGQ